MAESVQKPRKSASETPHPNGSSNASSKNGHVLEEHFRGLVQALPAAVYMTDAEGRILFYNAAAVDLWGRKPAPEEEWCGSYKIFNPDGSPLPVPECPMAVALKEKRAVRGQEIVVERPDGTRRNVMPHPEPIFDSAT